MSDIVSSNPHDKRRVLIGTLKLSDPHTFTDRSYECAAWWKRVAVPAGEYPVYTNGYYAFVEFPCTIEADYFASRLGASVLPYDQAQNAGKPATFHLSPYLYCAARSLMQFGEFVPAPGISMTDEAHGNVGLECWSVRS